MKKFKKLLAIGLATITTMSAKSLSAMANNTDVHGTVDSLDYFQKVSYTIDENGNITPVYDGISLLGAGQPYEPDSNSADAYLYGTGSTSYPGWHMNETATFSFTLTGNSAIYADFMIGATSPSKRVYFQAAPQGALSGSIPLDISIVPITSGGSTLSPKILYLKSSPFDSVSFNSFTTGVFYAIKIELNDLADKSKSYSGIINVQGSDF